jgi:hypothetical protein
LKEIGSSAANAVANANQAKRQNPPSESRCKHAITAILNRQVRHPARVQVGKILAFAAGTLIFDRRKATVNRNPPTSDDNWLVGKTIGQPFHRGYPLRLVGPTGRHAPVAGKLRFVQLRENVVSMRTREKIGRSELLRR